MLYRTILAAVAMGAVASAAPAIVVTQDFEIDLATAYPLSGFMVVDLPDTTLSLLPGDTLRGHVSFVGGAAVTLTNSPTSPGPGYEYVQISFYPLTGSVNGQTALTLTGTSGDLVNGGGATGLSNGGLFPTIFNDVTATQVSFTGFDYTALFTDGTATEFRPVRVGFGYDVAFGDPVQDAVPEPATWAMMVGGFGITGGMLRRRRAKLVRPGVAV